MQGVTNREVKRVTPAVPSKCLWNMVCQLHWDLPRTVWVCFVWNRLCASKWTQIFVFCCHGHHGIVLEFSCGFDIRGRIPNGNYWECVVWNRGRRIEWEWACKKERKWKNEKEFEWKEFVEIEGERQRGDCNVCVCLRAVHTVCPCPYSLSSRAQCLTLHHHPVIAPTL